jgi:hypothetical protein
MYKSNALLIICVINVHYQENSQFIRDISLLSSESMQSSEAYSDDLSFLDEFEIREEESQRGHVFAGAASGWKKGFLSGGKSNSKKVATASPLSAAEATPPSTAAATVTTNSNATAHQQDSQAEGMKVESINETEQKVTEVSTKTTVKKSAAFNGIIKERF